MTAALIHTLTSMDQPIIPAAGDGQTMTLLSQSSFPAIFLDGTLTTQTLLA
ncbi:MAG TPA: carboxyvinyl-carboxyphosphonate phosphorylmutase, partial [Lactobacillus sp.]|nr:carboxyvinyl-carboxyphosphonate phosphorylmutase [Lactobacillus sp.]